MSFLRSATFRVLHVVLGRRRTYRLGRALFLDARRDSALSWNCHHSGEPAILAAFCAHLRRGQGSHAGPTVVFDVGANIGDWTALLQDTAQAAGSAIEVHAFEPCAATCEQLRNRARLAGWSNVRIVPAGCSAKEGRATILIYPNAPGLSTIVGAIDNGASRSEDISVTTLDRYCCENGIARIDFLKVDAEGYDFEVLAGARGLIDNRAIDVIQFEYNWRWIGARRYLRDAFLLLQPHGYTIGKITLHGVEFYEAWCPEMEGYREANYLACRSALTSIFRQLRPDWLGSDAWPSSTTPAP